MNPKIMIFIRVAKQRKLSTNCYYMKALKDRSISFLASSTQVQRNIFQPTKVCFFSSAPNENTENEEMEDEDLKKRNKSIRINPKGLSNLILPNQMVYKINPKTGEKRKVPEVSIGSFWMMKVRLSSAQSILFFSVYPVCFFFKFFMLSDTIGY